MDYSILITKLRTWLVLFLFNVKVFLISRRNMRLYRTTFKMKAIRNCISTQNFTQTPTPTSSYPPSPVDRKARGIRGQGSGLLFIQQRNKVRNGALLEYVGLDLGLGEIVGILRFLTWVEIRVGGNKWLALGLSTSPLVILKQWSTLLLLSLSRLHCLIDSV